MNTPLRVLAFLLLALSFGSAQPFGLTNRVANTTLRMPLAPTPVVKVNYRIPLDNPFVGAASFNGLPVNSNNVRTEFYAVGLRNPWRWSFDPVTGLLWLADVGQGAREEVDIIHKGGNYGWAYREGLIDGPKVAQAPPGFTSINPIQDYGRTEGASITGGVVYRGSNIPELYGAYIFADYITGNIWQMRYEVNNGVTNITPYSRLTNETEIVCFGTDPSNGDVLMGDLNNDQIRRLLANPYRVTNAFGSLSFTDPMAIVTPPGETNRIFVVEQAGRISVITNLANPTRTVFMDISSRVRAGGEQGLLGLAFHPGYLTNNYFFVYYTCNTNGNQTGGGDTTRHDRLSRFEISSTNPNVGMTNSELILINQRDEASNHNAGDVHFGPDGYLYLSLGDEGDANDSRDNSQRIDKDFFSGIIRIDVDNRPESLMPNLHPANTNNFTPPALVLPPTLADTGAFTDPTTLTPNPGVIPYDVNTPYWTDGAIKSRWFSVPDVASRIAFRATQSWTFPAGTIWIQHFDLEMTNGVPSSRRKVETRFLVRDASANPGHYGVTYRWESETNAVLVGADGAEDIFEINDGGVPRFQTWHYPGQAECMVCHNGQSGRALGFNTPQLNRDFTYGSVVDNQLRSLNNVGYFSSPGVSNLYTLPVMARIDDETFSAQHRMRSYLMANCAHCHYLPNGPGQGTFNARIYLTSSTQGIIDGTLINNLGNPSNRVVKPGSLESSIAYVRMASEDGAIRMPPSGAFLQDQDALRAFGQWISELPSYPTFPAWQVIHFGATNAPNAAALADPDGDGARNQLEYLTGTNPNVAGDAWTIGIESLDDAVNVVYMQTPNQGFEVQWTTNLANSASWRVLNTPENRPVYGPQEQKRRIFDPVEPGVSKTYRVRVYEP